MLRTTAVDVAFFAASIALFVAYHLWLFTWDAAACVRARGACCGTATRLTPAAGRFRVAAEAARTRRAWVAAVLTDPSSGGQTYAVQVLRSHIMAATLLATTCGLIAIQGMLPALLDAGRLRQLRELAARDPVAPGVEGRWPSEGVKLVRAPPPPPFFFSFPSPPHSLPLSFPLSRGVRGAGARPFSSPPPPHPSPPPPPPPLPRPASRSPSWRRWCA